MAMSWFRRLRRSGAATPVVTPPRSRFSWRAGRRFSDESLYLLPNDAGEWNRIDFQHYLLRSVLHSNYVAPLQQPRTILDAGCAAGRWAMEMADQFPQAQVTGIDIVIPTAADGAAPESRPRPQNYRFLEASVLDPLPFDDGSFDYVHQRLLYGSVPVAKWPTDVAELVRVTAPGGWVELVEGGLMQNGGPHIKQINDWLIAAS